MATLDKTSPAAIFEKTLKKIETSLRRAKRPRAFKDAAVANGVRDQLFKLEGWSKLHRHWPAKKEQKIFQTLRAQSKTLEDHLGALDVARMVADDLREKAQPDLALLFDERAKKAQAELKHVLKSEHWLTTDPDQETRIEKMHGQLSKIDWPSPAAQFEYVSRALVRDLSDVSEKYRTVWKPQLLKPVYDRAIVDEALHEWRRQLRWFSMYFQTADGLFGLGPVGAMLTAEKKKLLSDYAENEFANLPTKRTTRAFVDRVAFYELTRIIEEIGVIKDRAERYFHIRDLLIKQGESEASAAARVRPLYGDVPNEIPVIAQKIMAGYERFKPLAYISESLP